MPSVAWTGFPRCAVLSRAVPVYAAQKLKTTIFVKNKLINSKIGLPRHVPVHAAKYFKFGSGEKINNSETLHKLKFNTISHTNA